MKIVIVNCFDTYEDRIDLIHDFFKKNGHDVTVIQSNYKHFDKSYRRDSKKNFIFIKTKPYYKNISIARLISHYCYAKKAFKQVEQIKPDLLYVTIPPNSLAKFATEYKRKYSSVKLVFDIIDLWPETMPVGKIKKWPPFTFWRSMRDDGLKYADLIITECDLYQTILRDVSKLNTIYLAKKQIETISHYKFNANEFHLCYLGSINNIIDIKTIKKLIQITNKVKPTILHIIGDGESKSLFINEIKSTGAIVHYYGKVYDSQVKQDIFDKCHFAINIMKPNVCVGLTMKSIDYFQYNIPILNNIIADTNQIIEKYKVGFNITTENLEDVARKVTKIEREELIEMRVHTKKVFIELFSAKAFEKKMDIVINKLVYHS